MKKVNFKELVIADIEGKEQKIDVSKLLGNQLYMEGQDSKPANWVSASISPRATWNSQTRRPPSSNKPYSGTPTSSAPP